MLRNWDLFAMESGRLLKKLSGTCGGQLHGPYPGPIPDGLSEFVSKGRRGKITVNGKSEKGNLTSEP